MEFDETIEYYKQEITNLRKKKDFGMLKAVAGDLKDYLRVNANKYKWSSELCEKKNGFMEKSYKIVKERSRNKCEICGKIGVEVHHLAGRSKMNVYHLPEFLIYVCRDCHKKFHGG
jgi:hypothetical protein